MAREDILHQIKGLIKEGNITKKELLLIHQDVVKNDEAILDQNQKRLTDILYFLGGGVVFLGICIFVGQNWKSLSSATKVLATLGSSVAMYIGGVLLHQSKLLQRVSEAFCFISALIAPLGVFVTMDIAGINVNTAGSHSMAAGILFITFLASYVWNQTTTFLVFTLIFATWLFFGLTTFLIGGRPFEEWDFVKYRWLACGASYLCLGHHYQQKDQKGVSSWLYGSGIFSFLTAAFVLGGWSPNQNVFWELIFPGLTFGSIFLSVYLRMKSFLVIGTMYLMFYIMKITEAYFSKGFGWPLALIISGFALMGIGYGAFYLNKKYIKVKD